MYNAATVVDRYLFVRKYRNAYVFVVTVGFSGSKVMLRINKVLTLLLCSGIVSLIRGLGVRV